MSVANSFIRQFGVALPRAQPARSAREGINGKLPRSFPFIPSGNLRLPRLRPSPNPPHLLSTLYPLSSNLPLRECPFRSHSLSLKNAAEGNTSKFCPLTSPLCRECTNCPQYAIISSR